MSMENTTSNVPREILESEVGYEQDTNRYVTVLPDGKALFAYKGSINVKDKHSATTVLNILHKRYYYRMDSYKNALDTFYRADEETREKLKDEGVRRVTDIYMGLLRDTMGDEYAPPKKASEAVPTKYAEMAYKEDKDFMETHKYAKDVMIAGHGTKKAGDFSSFEASWAFSVQKWESPNGPTLKEVLKYLRDNMSAEDIYPDEIEEAIDTALTEFRQRKPTIKEVGGFETVAYVWTNCPECGINVSVDEGGCCVSCGRDATQYGKRGTKDVYEPSLQQD